MKASEIQQRLVDKLREARSNGYEQMGMNELQTWLRQLNVLYPHIRREYVAWLEANGHIEIDKTSGVVKLA
jgi:hypothetical protein